MANGNNQLGLLSGAGNPMLDIGLGLLAAAGPSPTPISFGQALAHGFQNMQQGQLERLRLETARERLRKLADERRQRSAVQELVTSLGQNEPIPLEPVGEGLGALTPETVTRRQQQPSLALTPMQRQFLQAQAATDPSGALQSVGGLLFDGSDLSQKIAAAERELGRPLTETERLEMAGIEPRNTSLQQNVEFLEDRFGPLSRQEVLEMAPGTTINVGDNKLDQPIPLTQLPDVKLPNGQTAPIGTTFRQARDAGAVVLSSEEQKLNQQAESALGVINQLEQLAVGEQGIFSNVDSGFLNRAGAALDFGLDVLTQDDPRASRFRDLSGGTVGPLIRTLGEKGALAEGDVQRALGLLPRVFPLPDTGEVAKDKLRDLRNIINRGLTNLNRQEAEGVDTSPGTQGNTVDLGDGATLEIMD